MKRRPAPYQHSSLARAALLRALSCSFCTCRAAVLQTPALLTSTVTGTSIRRSAETALPLPPLHQLKLTCFRIVQGLRRPVQPSSPRVASHRHAWRWQPSAHPLRLPGVALHIFVGTQLQLNRFMHAVSCSQCPCPLSTIKFYAPHPCTSSPRCTHVCVCVCV